MLGVWGETKPSARFPPQRGTAPTPVVRKPVPMLTVSNTSDTQLKQNKLCDLKNRTSNETTTTQTHRKGTYSNHRLGSTHRRRLPANKRTRSSKPIHTQTYSKLQVNVDLLRFGDSECGNGICQWTDGEETCTTCPQVTSHLF